MIKDKLLGEQIVDAARAWQGTPYIHQASVKGQGADCLGLVRGVWRDVIGEEPQRVPGYSRDWSEVAGNETMLKAAFQWFRPITISSMQKGDLLLFRWKQVSIVKHAGIITAPDHFIHAYERAGVVETTLGRQWRKRIAAVFRFPDPKTFSING